MWRGHSSRLNTEFALYRDPEPLLAAYAAFRAPVLLIDTTPSSA
jgi:hypothetical protein